MTIIALFREEGAMHGDILIQGAFAEQANVSRETLDRLAIYLDLLKRWQKRINLVGPDTLNDPWRRHFLDSIQLAPILPPDPHRPVDLGSGAGFPGLVLAIATGLPFTLVEADQRKAVFLREVIRETATKCEVVPGRIEQIAPLGADLITARALAPLPRLLEWVQPHLLNLGICVFLKGKSAQQELTESLKTWNMAVRQYKSRSDPAGKVLRIEEISRKNGEHHP